MKHCT